MSVVDTYKSPNYSSRGDSKPFIHVVHYTGADNVESTLNWFQNKNSTVSAHEVIAKDGTRYAMVDKHKKAWHCGESLFLSDKYPDGLEDCNKYSFGYELVGVYGDEFTDRQYDSLAAAITEVLLDDEFPESNMFTLWDSLVGHEHIAFKRKVDPGESFDWLKLTGHIVDLLIYYGFYTPLYPVGRLPIVRHIQKYYYGSTS